MNKKIQKINSFDGLKFLVENNETKEIIEPENGYLAIKNKSINKYLEKYLCKDIFDLSDTLWMKYGIFLKIID